nr:PREDICTED: uncharacterized protein LOC108951919 [Musa acuminata subsp. malaccensis]
MFDDLSRCARISPPSDVHHAGPVVDELLDVRGVDEPGDAFFQHRLLARGFEHLLEWKKPSSECEVTTKDGLLVRTQLRKKYEAAKSVCKQNRSLNKGGLPWVCSVLLRLKLRTFGLTRSSDITATAACAYDAKEANNSWLRMRRREEDKDNMQKQHRSTARINLGLD